jgi:hypothetical protein
MIIFSCVAPGSLVWWAGGAAAGRRRRWLSAPAHAQGRDGQQGQLASTCARAHVEPCTWVSFCRHIPYISISARASSLSSSDPCWLTRTAHTLVIDGARPRARERGQRQRAARRPLVYLLSLARHPPHGALAGGGSYDSTSLLFLVSSRVFAGGAAPHGASRGDGTGAWGPHHICAHVAPAPRACAPLCRSGSPPAPAGLRARRAGGGFGVCGLRRRRSLSSAFCSFGYLSASPRSFCPVVNGARPRPVRAAGAHAARRPPG